MLCHSCQFDSFFFICCNNEFQSVFCMIYSCYLFATNKWPSLNPKMFLSYNFTPPPWGLVWIYICSIIKLQEIDIYKEVQRNKWPLNCHPLLQPTNPPLPMAVAVLMLQSCLLQCWTLHWLRHHFLPHLSQNRKLGQFQFMFWWFVQPCVFCLCCENKIPRNSFCWPLKSWNCLLPQSRLLRHSDFL